MQQLQEAKDAHRCARLLIPHTQMRLLYKPFKCLPTVSITVSASNLKWKHICGSSCQFWLLPPIQCDIMTAAEERLLVSRDGSPESSWKYSWLFNLFFFFLAAMLFYLFNNSLFVPSFQMDESSQLSTVLFWLTAMAAGTLAALFLRWNHWLCWARQMLLKWNILWWAFLFYCLLLLFCTRTVLARWDRANIGLSVKNIL